MGRINRLKPPEQAQVQVQAPVQPAQSEPVPAHAASARAF
jgi:hypothetical protein